MIVVLHTSTRGATYVCVYMLAYHTLYTNRDLLQVKFEKKNMICNKLHKFW